MVWRCVGGMCYVVVGVLRGRTWPVASVGVDPGGTLRGVLVYDVEWCWYYCNGPSLHVIKI